MRGLIVRASLALALPLPVDALGSVYALANAAGQVVERYTYDPYGQVTVRTGGGGTGLPRQPATYQFDSDRDGLLTDVDLGYLDACLLYENLWLEWWPCVFYHDANHNGLVDVQDRAVFGGVPGVTEPGSFSVQPPPELLRDSLPAGDSDADGDLDLWDYWIGLRSQGIAENDYILIHDLDGDQWVDQDDTYLLVASMEGPGQAVPEPGGPSRYGNPFLYTGQRWDPTTGLYHFWARSYDPVLGRWLQRDPMGALDLGGGGPSFSGWGGGPGAWAPHSAAGGEYADSFNLYQYAAFNPVAFTDSSGRFLDEYPEGSLLVTRDWDDIWDSIVGSGSAYLGVQGAATWGAYWGGNVTALPRFAVGAAGVSQGFSDFADVYAREVMFLPVQGVLAGMGQFGSYAGVAGASYRVKKGYSSFAALKRALGPAGPGKVWHHIVEQSKVGKFAVTTIQNVDNAVAIPRRLNEQLNGLYSSIRRKITGSEILTVREWLNSKSFAFNRNFGLEAIEKVAQGIW